MLWMEMLILVFNLSSLSFISFSFWVEFSSKKQGHGDTEILEKLGHNKGGDKTVN